MPILLKTLYEDWASAKEYSRMMLIGQIPIEIGIPVLQELISDVRNDVDTMDKEAKKKLDEEIILLESQNHKWKEEQKKANPSFNDGIDERNFKLKLLKADHMMYKKEIKFIQNLAHKKGWFD